MDDLTEPEQRLWDAFPESLATDLAGAPVRASVIAALALGVRPVEPGRTPAVRLFNARVTGQLDLSLASVPHPLILVGCEFDEAPVLDGAQMSALTLVRARLPGLQALGTRITGAFSLLECRCDGTLWLDGTDITGILDLTGAELRGDPAVRADYLTVGRDLSFRDAAIDGKVSLWNARIGQTLKLDAAHLSAPDVAFDGDGLAIGDGLFARAMEASGEFRLQHARIGRLCDLTGARLANPGGDALRASALKVDGTLEMSGGFTSEGRVTLRGSTLTGTLLMDGATLANPGGQALYAPNTEIGRSVRLCDGFSAEGGLTFSGARVGGGFHLLDSRVSQPGGIAVTLATASIGGGLSLRRTRLAGALDLTDAQVTASLTLKEARMDGVTGARVKVGGSVDCCKGFTARGRVSFTSAEIARDLCFDSATIDGDLELKRSRTGILRFAETTKLLGQADLRHATTNVLADFPSAWPEAVRLDGFVYETLHRPMPVGPRLQLLTRDTDGYIPQPYEQLAAVYRRTGHEGAARDVLLAKQRRRRSVHALPQRLWGYVQDWTVGYGYRPMRAATWLIALLTLGTLIFTWHHPPVLKPDEHPRFNPFLYTLDLLLPIISFGQESAFAPKGTDQWFAAALVASGWILATTIITGATRVLSRQ
ncbi:hypothetical protein [Actinomadura rupiterrae]|uniref:hypothetical protein n=1 Tax=Actinomadura rupiterrae TaxID=559627 RepID=UPI0020A5531C|nr:hypothetical protein [Actinomadura rupiterrae]MCP2339997.1 hypothetical protein [Actinomadura rupiterrae]